MAVNVARGDDKRDQEFQSALRRLITYMMEDPRTIGHAISVLFIIKVLERIGDRQEHRRVHYLSGQGAGTRHVSMDTPGKATLWRSDTTGPLSTAS